MPPTQMQDLTEEELTYFLNMVANRVQVKVAMQRLYEKYPGARVYSPQMFYKFVNSGHCQTLVAELQADIRAKARETVFGDQESRIDFLTRRARFVDETLIKMEQEGGEDLDNKSFHKDYLAFSREARELAKSIRDEVEGPTRGAEEVGSIFGEFLRQAKAHKSRTGKGTKHLLEHVGATPEKAPN